jgi:hypothetical protein
MPVPASDVCAASNGKLMLSQAVVSASMQVCISVGVGIILTPYQTLAIALVWSLPANTLHQELELVISLTGDDLLTVVLSPNRPAPLFPQLQRLLSVFSAAVWF